MALKSKTAKTPEVKRGRPAAGPPLTDDQAHFLSDLVSERGWSAEAFYLAFCKANEDTALSCGRNHFARLVTTEGTRAGLVSHMWGAFAKTFSVTLDSFKEYLKTGSLTVLQGANHSSPTAPFDQRDRIPSTDESAANDGKRVKASVISLDDKLLSDYLTGVGFAELMGSEDDWKKTIRRGKDWLKKHPEDFYCRGMLLWSVLRKGNPRDMIEILNETAHWLDTDIPVPSDLNTHWDSSLWREQIAEIIERIDAESVALPSFVRWHLEDTFVRAALMRYLRLQGKDSHMRTEFAKLGRELEKQYFMKVLSALPQSSGRDSWVSAAVGHVNQWANLEHESGLARLCLLWFIGRQGQPEHMQSAIDQSCRWLERHPNHALVRWATIWLAGLCPDTELTIGLIDDSAKWLETVAPDDERLVRMGFLWFVGAKGNPAQVRRVIAQTARWLKAHPKDDFIRVAYLLFLIRRRGQPEHFKKAIRETRAWLRANDDVHELVAIAMSLCD